MAGKFGGDEISAQMATCPAASSCQQEHGSGCPQCCGRKVCKHNSLATKALMVAAHWDYEENVGRPDSVVAQSSQPVGSEAAVAVHSVQRQMLKAAERINSQPLRSARIPK